MPLNPLETKSPVLQFALWLSTLAVFWADLMTSLGIVWRFSIRQDTSLSS